MGPQQEWSFDIPAGKYAAIHVDSSSADDYTAIEFQLVDAPHTKVGASSEHVGAGYKLGVYATPTRVKVTTYSVPKHDTTAHNMGNMIIDIIDSKHFRVRADDLPDNDGDYNDLIVSVSIL